MCAIIDADCIDHVFSPRARTKAGEDFYRWLDRGGKLVVGGSQFMSELGRKWNFLQWAKQMQSSGKKSVKRLNDQQIDAVTKILQNKSSCISDDSHIIALAQVSKARLLYSRDNDLRTDFKNKHLIDNPRGKIYVLGESYNATKARKNLLAQRNLCQY